MVKILTSVLLFFHLTLVAQITYSDDGLYSYGPQSGIRVEESPPIWPGCIGNVDELRSCFDKSLSAHISKEFIIPYEVGNKTKSNKIIVFLRISKKGDVILRKIKGGIPEIQEIAKKAIKSIPSLKPGELGGKKINADYTLPIFY